MKKRLYKITVICIAGFFGLLSCTREFEDINRDPNAFSSAKPQNQLAGAMKATLDMVGGWMNDHMFMNYAQYYGGMGGQFERFYWTESGIIGIWEDFYVDQLANLQAIIDDYGDDPDYANQVYITKIWKSYVFSVLASTFGDVPMSEAISEATLVGLQPFLQPQILSHNCGITFRVKEDYFSSSPSRKRLIIELWNWV